MAKRIMVLLLVLVALWGLFPRLLLVQTSFMSSYALMGPARILRRATLNNWRELPPGLMLKWFRNSVIVSGSVVVGTTLVCILAGLGFAKHEFPGKEPLFWLFLMSMVVPSVMLFLPKFLIIRGLGLFDNYLGMIVPSLVYPAGVFFSRQYLSRISDDLLEAARIDGASELQVFRHIVLPLAKPLVVIISLFVFVMVWQDFMWQFLVARNSEIQTLVVGIGSVMRGKMTGGEFSVLQGSGVSLEGLQAASAILLALPPLVLFVVGQKYFMEGLRVGAAE